MRRVLAGAAGLAIVGALAGAGAATPATTGSWTGRYMLGSADELSVTLSGKRALVALGAAHAELQSVPLSTSGGRVRFQLPGRPAPLSFDGAIAKGRLSGIVRQGSARGTFSAGPGAAADLIARGTYATGGGIQAVVDDPYGPARLVDLDSGRVRALYSSGSGFAIGSGFATRSPSTGKASFGTASATIEAVAARRVRVRQLEVRFKSGAVTLAGTLSLPPGAGRHAAVAFVHGSGFTNRAYLPELSALFLRHGVAVLVYDKRGVGQSGGVYPGESPTAGTIDTLARDAAAAARFLAAQPEIDRSRVGLTGHSQAGWIAPLAASREPAIRFLALFSGPAVTADENDLYQNLAGEGDRPPEMSEAAIDAEVLKRGPGGVDPIPSIRKLKIPALWVFGGKDNIMPPRLSARRLAPIVAEPGRDFTVVDFPNANHALVETKTGLTSEMLRSDTFAPGLFARVGDWLAEHRLAAPLR
jgi:pimeloyl-ACP methyl ester carboxylesterase